MVVDYTRCMPAGHFVCPSGSTKRALQLEIMQRIVSCKKKQRVLSKCLKKKSFIKHYNRGDPILPLKESIGSPGPLFIFLIISMFLSNLQLH